MQKRHKFPWRWICLVVVALILGTAVYQFNAKTLMGDPMPMPLGFGVSVVLSGSMEPELSVDDLVIIRKTQDVSPGDVIVFQQGSSLVIHRLIDIQGDQLITKGDANNIADKPISRSDVKGVLVSAIPGVGVAVHFIRQPIVIFLLLAGAVFLAYLSGRREQSEDEQELSDLQRQIHALASEIREKKGETRDETMESE